MGYIRLQRGNDWGVDYFTRPGEALAGPFKTASASRGIKFPEGHRIHVRWPDNEQTVETVAYRKVDGTVSDMGRSYGVRSSIPGFETHVHGVKHWTSIDDVDVLEEDLP